MKAKDLMVLGAIAVIGYFGYNILKDFKFPEIKFPDIKPAINYFQGKDIVTGEPAVTWIGPSKQYPVFPSAIGGMPQRLIEGLPMEARAEIRSFQAVQINREISAGTVPLFEGPIFGANIGVPTYGSGPLGGAR